MDLNGKIKIGTFEMKLDFYENYEKKGPSINDVASLEGGRGSQIDDMGQYEGGRCQRKSDIV